ncbi:hypothetical protein ACQ4M3_19265 [Leptolyngbya sp. AN03gr2]|uniref:hypothetical protein n=1 Tax=Leptolyngbya sp. AN03gr2 TaxID=3423364 RepID=UPI003D323DBE
MTNQTISIGKSVSLYDLSPCATKEIVQSAEKQFNARKPVDSVGYEIIQQEAEREVEQEAIIDRILEAQEAERIANGETEPVDRQGKASKSFIKKKWQLKFTERVLARIDEIALKYDLTKQERIVFCHIYSCWLAPRKYEEGDGVVVPYETVFAEFKQTNILKNLVAKGLIVKVKYGYGYHSHVLNKATEYIPNLDIVETLSQARSQDLAAGQVTQYDLKGKAVPYRRRTRKNDKENSNPPIVQASINGMQWTIFDKHNIDRQFEFYDQHRWIIEMDSAAWKRIQGDLRCYEEIMAANAREVPGTNGRLWMYQPSWIGQAFAGRISELGGGLQSCSREMKFAAFGCIPGMYNYDLKSAHIYFLLQDFEERGLPTEAVWVILNQDKVECAKYVGISVDCFKKCRLSLMFGSSLPTGNQVYVPTKKQKGKTDPINEINKLIWDESEGKGMSYEERIEWHKAAIEKLCELLSPFEEALKGWRGLLVEEALKNAYRNCKGECCFKNAVGAVFNLSDDEYRTEEGSLKNHALLGRRLASFKLQGMESLFINSLAVLGSEHDFTVNHNQHDGLITIGKIPDAAVEEAKRITGIRYATMELKPLSDTKWIEQFVDSSNPFDGDPSDSTALLRRAATLPPACDSPSTYIISQSENPAVANFHGSRFTPPIHRYIPTPHITIPYIPPIQHTPPTFPPRHVTNSPHVHPYSTR